RLCEALLGGVDDERFGGAIPDAVIDPPVVFRVRLAPDLADGVLQCGAGDGLVQVPAADVAAQGQRRAHQGLAEAPPAVRRPGPHLRQLVLHGLVRGLWGLWCALSDELRPPVRVVLGAALDAGPVADLLPDCLRHLGAGVFLWVVPGEVRFLDPDVGRQFAGGLAWLDGGGYEGEPPAGPVRLAPLEVD